MAHYLVTAVLRPDMEGELRARLDGDDIADVRPFGPVLQESLERARLAEAATRTATWEEECHCPTPLMMEREQVLDRYFNQIGTEEVDEGEGWERIEDLPSLWGAPSQAQGRR